MKKGKEIAMEILFLVAACISIVSVVLICVFLFANGIPAIKEIGFAEKHGDREMIYTESSQ